MHVSKPRRVQKEIDMCVMIAGAVRGLLTNVRSGWQSMSVPLEQHARALPNALFNTNSVPHLMMQDY